MAINYVREKDEHTYMGHVDPHIHRGKDWVTLTYTYTEGGTGSR